MYKLIKYLTLILAFFSFIYFYSDIEKVVWFYRIAILDTSEEKLASKGGETAIKVAEKLLNSNEHSLNTKGLILSAKIGSGQLVPLLIKFINSDNNINSDLAIQALSATSSEDMIEPLSNISKNVDSRGRLGILQVLSQIKSKKDISSALKIFTKDPSWVIRMTLSDELSFHDNSQSIELLKKLISDDYIEVAFTAASSLGSLGQKNEFVDIFSRLKPESSWIDKVKSIRLLSLFPEKIVGLVVAMHVKSEFKFLATAAIEWMMFKGDEKDFSLIIEATNNIAVGPIKYASILALASLSEKANRKDQIILNLMKFLQLDNELITVASLQGLKYLNASVSADEVFKLIEFNKNDPKKIDLTSLAIDTLCSFKQEKHLKYLIEFLYSDDFKKRTSAYLGLINYPELPSINLNFKPCNSVEEAEALGLFLAFFIDPVKSNNILEQQFANAKTKLIKIKILEMYALLNNQITTLKLINLLEKNDLNSFEKAKSILDNSLIKLNVPALIDGFLFYLKRQPKNVKYSLMSFSQASDSFFNQKDTLYLRGEDSGQLQGDIVYEDYNSYYFANNDRETIQISKDLVTGTYFSPLYELLNFRNQLPFFESILSIALNSEKWAVASYILQKVYSHVQILKTEISFIPVASNALFQIENLWFQKAQNFKNQLLKLGLAETIDGYMTFREIIATTLSKLSPEEAKNKQTKSDELFKTGQSYAESGDFDKAIEEYKKALEIWPLNNNALKEIGISYAKKGDYDKAINFYTKLTNKRANDSDLLNSMSIVYRLKKDHQKALKILTQEIACNPSLTRGRIDASDVLIELDQVQDAIDILKSGLKLAKDPFDLHFKLSKLYRKQNMFDLSISEVNECLKIKPEDVNCLTYMGLLYFSKGKTIEAVNYLKKAIIFDIANIDARLTLAEIYVSSGALKDAEIELNKILAIDPKNTEAMAMLGKFKK